MLEPGADGPDRGEDNHGDDARADREARSAASYRMCVTHRNPRAPAPGRPPRARMPVPVIVRSSNECRVQAASGSSARESAQKFVPLRAHATPPAVRPGVCWTPGCCVCGGEAIAGAGCCVRSAWAPGRTPSPCLPHRGRTRGRSTPAGGPAAFWSRSPASTPTRWSSPAGPSKQPPGWRHAGARRLPWPPANFDRVAVREDIEHGQRVPGKEGAVGVGKRGPADVALQDQQLVPQRKDLDVFVPFAHRQQSKEREGVGHGEVGQAQQRDRS